MDVVAGPFHPAFRQLVESKLILNKIENIILSRELSKNTIMTIFTGNTNISNVIGHKRGNIKYLKEKYGFLQININENNELNSNILIYDNANIPFE